MAVFECKMCGGALDVTPGVKIVKCSYCDSSQTVAADDDEKKVNLFNRANALRIRCEFDKAEALYESILADFPTEAEAYWGICLCRYGIEYVDDPRTGMKIPTCHRTSFKSIYDDECYLKTLENSDASSRQFYCAEAHTIDELQRGILKVVNSVEPYDVFICYKETGADGQRTKDSVMAEDMYEALTDKGYKVFFSRITLEDKLGREYEPYIFAALNSAKVMLAVGTKPEHFEAVWVKNEWGRYLDLMRTDRGKTLIPCYCDMTPYQMPSEFRNLQGQDMGRIGFIQDLVRGIGKIVGTGAYAAKVSLSKAFPQQSGGYSQTYAAANAFEATLSQHNGPSLIERVSAIGTNNPNDTWPAGNMSSTFDISQFSVVMFQIFLRQPLGYNGQARLGYAVFDNNGNILDSDESVFVVQSEYDKFAQGITLRRADGSRVQTGQYRAVFWVNDSQAMVFNFTVTESGMSYSTSYSSSSYIPTGDYAPVNTHTKSKALALVLSIIFGNFGVYCFYLGYKKRGIAHILLNFIPGFGSAASWIWSIVDFIRIATGKLDKDADGNPIQ